ncbi:MAG TPA: hypothetical protein PLN34_03225 [Alloprevotella sp.]|nr:hypothetical protein [Alloprevotella sp.]
MVLHLFNASHDEALASNSPFYNPAQAARTLEKDLALLPVWWAADEDCILLDAESAGPPRWVGNGVRAIYPHEADTGFWNGVERIEPWGWDSAVMQRLRRLGAPERLLPDGPQLRAIRQLSSRYTSVRLLQKLCGEHRCFAGESLWCCTEAEVWEALDKYGKTMLKAPWSGSGRGVFRVDGPDDRSSLSRIRRILRLQGAIEAEPFYERLADFALEFQADGTGNVRYEGLSVFRTTNSRNYAGNMIGREEELTATLLSAAPAETGTSLELLKQELPRQLALLLGTDYRGPLGIDMMLVRTSSGTIAIHPCVEINLRRTMGHVALNLTRLSAPGQELLFTLRPVPSAGSDTLSPRHILTPNAREIEAVLLPIPALRYNKS